MKQITSAWLRERGADDDALDYFRKHLEKDPLPITQENIGWLLQGDPAGPEWFLNLLPKNARDEILACMDKEQRASYAVYKDDDSCTTMNKEIIRANAAIAATAVAVLERLE